jgi:hypothetical protein
MSFRDPRASFVRRDLARRSPTFAAEAEALARLAPGGSPDHPLELSSASQVEVRAQSTPCPICTGELRVEEHEAEVLGGRRLRVVRVRCHHCAAPRQLYFRIGTALPS